MDHSLRAFDAVKDEEAVMVLNTIHRNRQAVERAHNRFTLPGKAPLSEETH